MRFRLADELLVGEIPAGFVPSAGLSRDIERYRYNLGVGPNARDYERVSDGLNAIFRAISEDATLGLWRGDTMSGLGQVRRLATLRQIYRWTGRLYISGKLHEELARFYRASRDEKRYSHHRTLAQKRLKLARTLPSRVAKGLRSGSDSLDGFWSDVGRCVTGDGNSCERAYSSAKSCVSHPGDCARQAASSVVDGVSALYDAVKSGAADISDFVGAAADKIKSSYDTIDDLLSGVRSLYDEIKAKAGEAVAVKTIFVAVGKFIGDDSKSALEAALNSSWSAIVDKIPDGLKKIVVEIGEFAAVIIGGVVKVVDGIRKIGEGIENIVRHGRQFWYAVEQGCDDLESCVALGLLLVETGARVIADAAEIVEGAANVVDGIACTVGQFGVEGFAEVCAIAKSVGTIAFVTRHTANLVAAAAGKVARWIGVDEDVAVRARAAMIRAQNDEIRAVLGKFYKKKMRGAPRNHPLGSSVPFESAEFVEMEGDGARNILLRIKLHRDFPMSKYFDMRVGVKVSSDGKKIWLSKNAPLRFRVIGGGNRRGASVIIPNGSVEGTDFGMSGVQVINHRGEVVAETRRQQTAMSQTTIRAERHVPSLLSVMPGRSSLLLQHGSVRPRPDGSKKAPGVGMAALVGGAALVVGAIIAMR